MLIFQPFDICQAVETIAFKIQNDRGDEKFMFDSKLQDSMITEEIMIETSEGQRQPLQGQEREHPGCEFIYPIPGGPGRGGHVGIYPIPSDLGGGLDVPCT